MGRVFRASLDLGSVWAVLDDVAASCEVFGEDGQTLKHWRDEDHGAQVPKDLPNIVAHRYVKEWSLCQLGVGEHFPRMWRGRPSPDREHYVREWSGSYGAVSSIVRRMAEVFRFVEPNADNASAYGHEIRQLLIMAATEVESSWRAVLAANSYTSGEGRDSDRLTTRDYVKLLVPMRLNEWRVVLAAHQGFGTISPFENWDEARPTSSLPWYEGYNAAKHDRENNFAQATLRHAVTAVVAAYVMVVAQFGEFDNRHFLGLDEFRQDVVPSFSPPDSYIPPSVGGGSGIWTPVPYWLLAFRQPPLRRAEQARED